MPIGGFPTSFALTINGQQSVALMPVRHILGIPSSEQETSPATQASL